MNRFIHYLIMWGVFTILFTLATVGLEILEGNKIKTTEYYGLMNLGFLMFIVFYFIFGLIIYPISFLPLTFLANKFVNSTIVRIVIYSIIGGISGIGAFNRLYGGYFINRYELNISSAIIVFGVSGLIYALVDYISENKTLVAQQE
ncbi:hypothetical protein [Caldalkalibacillus salinus]|uniref:hypothetical protein n=1 Tax=Caldalkalibacillus salinus TaxID=2803787 RepID=UPI001922BA6C|nr:hypothetical protein [Caldalkalibacillus salinus]